MTTERKRYKGQFLGEGTNGEPRVIKVDDEGRVITSAAVTGSLANQLR